MRTPSASGSSKTTACCSKIGLKRGPWSPEEDELLSNYINKEGEGKWRTLPKRAGLLRFGKSCRLRWMNYLRPCVKRGQIAADEEDLILRLHRLLGNRWSLIAGRIPGRTDNEIKNYWNTHLSKKLISQGIDPRTHKPLDPQSANQLKLGSSSKPVNRKSSLMPSPKMQNNDMNAEINNSKTNHPNSSSSGVEDTTSGSGIPIVNNKESVYFDEHEGYVNSFNCSDELQIMRASNYVNVEGINNNADEDLNCFTDNIFSCFLNSLINEEPFAAQQQQQPQQQQLINGIFQPSEPFNSITDCREPSLLPSNFNANDHQHPSN